MSILNTTNSAWLIYLFISYLSSTTGNCTDTWTLPIHDETQGTCIHWSVVTYKSHPSIEEKSL